MVVGIKRVCVFCFAKALRTVLDYWQFENLHSLSFAIAKQLLISIFSLGRRSVRYCSLQPCQNPLCRQSASWLSAINVSACFASQNHSALSWICFVLAECRFRHSVPVNAICSLPEFRFAQYVRKSALPTIRCLVVGIKRVCVFCFAKPLRTLPTIRFSNSTSGV